MRERTGDRPRLKRGAAIRDRVLRGIALNRRPGFQFPGNFLGVSFDRVSRGGSRLSLEPGPWCADGNGETDLGSLAILADLALASCIRARLSRETRLATVGLQLQFTGAPISGRLLAAGRFEGFFSGAAGRLGASRVSVAGDAGTICHGAGSFMALDPPREVKLHPVPLRTRRAPEPERPTASSLSDAEREILRRADRALARNGDFASAFWGYRARRTAAGAEALFANGPQVGNRVGHVQGGIMLGLAAATASAALPRGWRLAGVSAWYIRPGRGERLRAVSRILHRGGLTAVLRTRITGGDRRRVLEVVTSHCALSG